MVGGPSEEDERYTFTFLITSLIGIEERLEQLYEATAAVVEQPDLKSLLRDFAKSSSRRGDMMRRARVDSVVEMALEPITGLKLPDLRAKINATTRRGRICETRELVTLERTVSDFYAMASTKITMMSAEMSEIVQTLSRQSMERVKELERFST